jgi:hypothetical protein
MAQIATVLSSARSTDETGAHLTDVKVDPGGNTSVTAEHYAAAGDDSLPLPGDSVALDDSSGTGVKRASAYADTKNAGKAGPGEKRSYARAADGTPVVEMWLKADGTFVISGLLPAGGKIELDPLTGTLDLNGLKIDTSGNLTTPGEITAKDATPATSVTLSRHLHGTAVGPTSAPTPGT